MPEGPSILILKESVIGFSGKKVLEAGGNAKIDPGRLAGQKITGIHSYGKQLLIGFKGFYIRIHLLMFGTYRINERKDLPPRLSLLFNKGEINFYTCNVRLEEGDVNDLYDWERDILSDTWNPQKAEKSVKALDKTLVCDVLLDQDVFAGVGNIIKNEVLFRIKVHPASEAGALPPKKRKELVKEAQQYSWDFYHWKKANELKKHWLIYKKRECPRCKLPATTDHLGKTGRLTSYCANCQVLYKNSKKVKAGV